MKMFLLAMLLGSASPVFAGDTTIGNGGDLVHQEGSAYYLLDLFEAGLERNPYFDPAVKAEEEFLRRVRAALPLEPATQDLLAQKLTEISRRDLLLGHALLRVTELLRWRLVGYELLNVPDEGTVYKGELFQGAIRQGLTVFLQNNIWRNTPLRHRVALITHELIYALFDPEAIPSGQRVQRSYRVREINAYLYSNHWSEKPSDLYRAIHGSLPTDGGGGFRQGESADEFYAAPMIVIVNSETGRISALRARSVFDLDEASRVDGFCEMFSWASGGMEGKGAYHNIGRSSLRVELDRASYTSPLGLLDYIRWKPEGGALPPYNTSLTSFPRLVLPGESLMLREGGVIFDFGKYRPGQHPVGEAKAACTSFLKDGLARHGHLLEEFR